MNKGKGSTEKTTTITNERETNKIATFRLEERNINARITSKFHTFDLKKNNIIEHFMTRDIQFST